MYNDSTKKFLILPVLLAVFILVGCQNNSQKYTENQKEIILETPENQQNTDSIDTSDWQTYTNKEFGFEIKYPPTTTWHTIPRPDSGTQEIEHTSVPTQILLTKKDDVWAPEGGFAVGFGCGVPNQSVDFGVTVHPKTNQQYEQIILKDLHYDTYHTLHTKKIVNAQGVTGVEIAIQTQNNSCSIYSTSVFFEKNDFVYEINHMGECGEEFSGFTEKEQAFIDYFAFL